MQVIKCFEVKGHTDTIEGRGPLKIVARFANRDVAKEYVESKLYATHCVMGRQSKDDLRHISKETITILDTIDEIDVMNKENIRAKALAKLTKEEREVLGL